MDQTYVNLIQTSISQVIEKWSQLFNSDPNYQDKEGHPLYKLVIVGGKAINSILPKDKQIPTSDLDLKLVYNKNINPHEFFRIFRNQFNKLRTKIMLEMKSIICNLTKTNQTFAKYLEKTCHSFNDNKGFPEYFSVAINYKYPYLIYSYDDTIRCNNRYNEMVHMVMSLIYHHKESEKTTCLVDLSMFVNLNNPDRLFHLPLNNYLYLAGKCWSSNNPLPALDVNLEKCTTLVKVPVAQIGYLMADLLWLSLLHHREEKRERAKEKMAIVLQILKDNSKLPSDMLLEIESLLGENYLLPGYMRLKNFYFERLTKSDPKITEIASSESTPQIETLTPEYEMLNRLTKLESLLSLLNNYQKDNLIVTYPDHLV